MKSKIFILSKVGKQLLALNFLQKGIRLNTIRLFCIMLLMQARQFNAQVEMTVYDNFEGDKSIHYTIRNGVLDTMAKNPAPDKINNSPKCALYIRNSSKKFDNIKMRVIGKLTDVAPFATYLGTPPKLKMKIFTSAPAGTLVEILLGSQGRNNEYPAGTNSQYQAYTTKTNAWEELEFKFSQTPQGSETSTTSIDQITLLFNPNTLTSDTYYFDDITGPAIAIEKSEPIVEPKTVDNPDKNKEKENKKEPK